MQHWIFGIAIAAFVWVSSLLPVQAKEFCRAAGDRQVCIVRIERSAKNYREYRAQVKIDGKKRPLEIYDCQRQQRRSKDGTRTPFEANGAGEVVCGALDR